MTFLSPVLELLLPGNFTPEHVALPENDLSPYGYAGDHLWVREKYAAFSRWEMRPLAAMGGIPIRGCGWLNFGWFSDPAYDRSMGKNPEVNSDPPYGERRDRADDRRSLYLVFASYGSSVAALFPFAGKVHGSRRLLIITSGC